MATFNERLPARQELIYLFAICAFPLHIWLAVNVLREVPAWILRLSLWDVIGVVAYSLLFTLLETTILFAGILLLAFILPQRWFRQRFTAWSAMLVIVTSVWFVILHYNSFIIGFDRPLWSVVWAVSYVVGLGALYFLIDRKDRVELFFQSFVKRLSVLSFLYIALDVVGLVIVFIRNI